RTMASGVPLAVARDGGRKQRPEPFATKVRIDIIDRVRRQTLQLALGGVHVELNDLQMAAALEPSLGFPRVGDEAVEARPQIRAKAGLAGVEGAKEVLLECTEKERLREIGGLVGRGMPFRARVLDHR